MEFGTRALAIHLLYVIQDYIMQKIINSKVKLEKNLGLLPPNADMM